MKKIIIICLISLSVLIVGSILFLTSKYAISLNGEEVVKVEVGKKYKELGAKSIIDFKNIKTSGKVDTKKIGTYQINYKYFYSNIKRIVKVVDTIKPVINLDGNIEINLAIGGTYKEPGYNSSDNYDGDLTKKVVIII